MTQILNIIYHIFGGDRFKSVGLDFVSSAEES